MRNAVIYAAVVGREPERSVDYQTISPGVVCCPASTVVEQNAHVGQ